MIWYWLAASLAEAVLLGALLAGLRRAHLRALNAVASCYLFLRFLSEKHPSHTPEVAYRMARALVKEAEGVLGAGHAGRVYANARAKLDAFVASREEDHEA